MSKVGIVTDSTNCLSPELLKEYDIRVVPFGVTIDGKSYLDQIEITNDMFWEMFPKAKKIPTTGAPSPGAFAEVFTDLGKHTKNIVCMVVSAGLSAVYESALQGMKLVKSEHPEFNIEIIDSRTSTGALGFLALEAARAAQAGASFDKVVQLIQEMIPKVKFIVGLETLKYLIKGGRAPKTAWVGELLSVKPIIGVVSGKGVVESLGKVRGTLKAMHKMADILKDYTDTSKPLHLMVHYTNRIEDGEKLKDIVTSRYDCAEVYLTPYTPVMATHTGPSVALSFYS